MDVEEAHLNSTEINKIVDKIDGGDENRLRLDGEEQKFSRRAAIGMTPYTGCAIKFISNITYWDRSINLYCKEVFLHEQAEIEEGEDDDTEDEALSRPEPALRSGWRPSDVSSDVLLGIFSEDCDATIHRCGNCNRTFRRVANLHFNIKVCDGRN